jgi:hypothetical protein
VVLALNVQAVRLFIDIPLPLFFLHLEYVLSEDLLLSLAALSQLLLSQALLCR